jgi:Fe-S oxidoreductase
VIEPGHGAMSQIAFPIVWAVGLAVFCGLLVIRARPLLSAQPAGRFDHFGARLRRALVDGVGQRKFLSGEQPAGIMHALIFWGFLVLMLQVITLFGRAFDASWNIPGFAPDQPLGPPFFLLRDVLEGIVIVGCVYMLYRRLVLHTPRLFGSTRAEQRYHDAPHWEGVLILVFIVLIMVGGLLYDAGRLVAFDIHGNERDFAPLTAAVAAALGGLSRSSADTVSQVGWWVHCVTILVFLNLLPLSKHFHIITAIPNVYFAKLPPPTVARPLAITQVKPAADASLDPPRPGSAGVVSANDLSWKQVLDAYTCTECGRCSAVCPAAAAGTPLAPRQLILDLRDRIYHPGASADDAGPLIDSDVLWSCTTCMACVEACPVGIEHVPTIVDMRRHLVEEGEMDPLLAQTLQKLAMQGNSFGKSARMRPRWTKGLDFTIPDARTEAVDYLWFVGDYASFDDRVVPEVQRLARILHAAGVSFGLLFEGERNAGNDVRRVGEEGLFEVLAEHNMGALSAAHCQAIFTTDPHSLNTLRNEYPRLGLDRPVYHHTELLADLVSRGAIRLAPALAGARVTYHDPCYLARYNHITEAPRRLIEATGAELVEMPRHGTETFCCGAGGGRIWMSESGDGERPSEQRIREAQSLGGLDVFVVSCPKDLAMYSAAAETVGAEFEVAELTSLVERALVDGSSRIARDAGGDHHGVRDTLAPGPRGRADS